MDWKQLIADILAKGYTQAEIAARVGCARSTINEMISQPLPRGPNYNLGLALQNLHRSAMRRKDKK